MLRHHTGLVNSAVWTRGTIVVVSAALAAPSSAARKWTRYQLGLPLALAAAYKRGLLS